MQLASIFPPDWTTPTPGTRQAATHLDTAISALGVPAPPRDAVELATREATTAVKLLENEPPAIVPARFAAGQARLGISHLERALANPDPKLLAEARMRLEQARGVLPE